MPREYQPNPFLVQGKCPVCGNVRTLKNNGRLRVHGDPTWRLMNCSGSGQRPVAEAGESGD